MSAGGFTQRIAELIDVLRKDAGRAFASVRAESDTVAYRQAFDFDSRNAEIDIGGVRRLIDTEARRIEARLIEQRRRKDVVVEERSRRVERFEWQIGHRPALRRRIAVEIIESREIGAEGEGVFFGRREIEAEVKLIAAILPRQLELYLLNVGNAVKVEVGQVDILSGRAVQRADVKPVPRDVAAIFAILIFTEDAAIRRQHVEYARLGSGGRKNFRRDAVRALTQHELAELRCFDISLANITRAVPQSFVREEEERFVFAAECRLSALAESRQRQRAAQAAAELANIIIDANSRRVVRAAVLVKFVQLRRVVFHEPRTVQVVGPVLRNDSNLRAGIAPVFGRIAVREHANLFDRLLIRRNERRAAPVEAVDADAVNLEVVGGKSLAVGGNLDLILRLKDRVFRPARPRRVRKVDRVSIAGARAVAEDARRQAQEFIRVSPDLRQLANLHGRNRAGDVGVLLFDRRRRFAGYGDGLADDARLKRYVDAGHALGADGDVFQFLFLEALAFDGQFIRARSERQKTIEAVAARGHFGLSSGLFVDKRDFRSGNNRPGRVRHCSLNAGFELRPGRRRT